MTTPLHRFLLSLTKKNLPSEMCCLLCFGLLISSSVSNAAVLTNGDFENTTGWLAAGTPGSTGFPAGWTNNISGRDNAADQQSGSNAIGGAGTSAFMPAFYSTSDLTRREITQSFSAFAGDWYLDFDFASEDPGGALDRSVSMSLFAGGAIMLGFRIVDLDLDGDGDVQFLSGGSSWTTVADLQSSVIFDSDVQVSPQVHHLSIAYSSALQTYSVSLTDSSNATFSATGVNLFGTAGSAADVSQVQFNTFTNSGNLGDYLIDNVRIEVTAIPEPGTAALALFAGSILVLGTRRRNLPSTSNCPGATL